MDFTLRCSWNEKWIAGYIDLMSILGPVPRIIIRTDKLSCMHFKPIFSQISTNTKDEFQNQTFMKPLRSISFNHTIEEDLWFFLPVIFKT